MAYKFVRKLPSAVALCVCFGFVELTLTLSIFWTNALLVCPTVVEKSFVLSMQAPMLETTNKTIAANAFVIMLEVFTDCGCVSWSKLCAKSDVSAPLFQCTRRFTTPKSFCCHNFKNENVSQNKNGAGKKKWEKMSILQGRVQCKLSTIVGTWRLWGTRFCTQFYGQPYYKPCTSNRNLCLLFALFVIATSGTFR